MKEPIKCTKYVKLNTNPLENAYDIDNKDDTTSNYLIIKMMIAGAFFPNYFTGQKIDLDQAHRLIGGLSGLANTVQLKCLPNNQGILYDRQIYQFFKKIHDGIMQVHYEDTKAYVEFKTNHSGVNSNINISVLLACQMSMFFIYLVHN